MLVPVTFGQGIKKEDTEIEGLSFKQLNLREEHLEEFLRNNIDVLFEEGRTLQIVGQQVMNKEKGRSDLVAVDESGNMVLIEIKRDLEDIKNRKEPFEFQAIRYAANYARINTPDEIVSKLFAPYIEKHLNEYGPSELTTTERARRIITTFLEQHNALHNFNRRQSIVLVASEFDDQTLSSSSWLINNGVDINCYTVRPTKMGAMYLLDINRILPPPRLEDYYVDVLVQKVTSSFEDSIGRTRSILPRMPKLFEWGIVINNDRLSIKGYPDSEAAAVNPVEVNYHRENMSYTSWGKKVTGWSSICIYDWALSKRLGDTLSNLRKAKMVEENMIAE
ncbi:MAG: hypothetical protein ACYCX4_00055 [Bacillota bacterium]